MNARPAILRAAVEEFAEQGFAGARMDAIASAAGVNIALLFYYFKSKDLLYKAALEEIFASWRRRVLPNLRGPGSSTEKLLSYINSYFDLAENESPSVLRLMYQEIMRQGQHSSPHLSKLAQQYVKPIHFALRRVVRQGAASGEFESFDPEHFVYSMMGMMNYYFVSSSVVRLLSSHDPWSKKGIEIRRHEVIRFIQLALMRPKHESMG